MSPERQATPSKEVHQKKLLYHLTTEPGTVFIPGDKRPQWIETVDIFDDKTANYLFMKNTPLCQVVLPKGRYEHEFNGELLKRGWNVNASMMYKENVSFEGLLECIAYGISYRKVYETNVKDPLAGIPFTICGFLDLVDSQADAELVRLNELHKQELIIDGSEGIVKIVLAEGHRLKRIVD